MDERLNASMPEDQKAVFERVWKRVMTGSRETCPITWGGEAEDTETQAPAAPVEPGGTEGETPPESGGGENTPQPPAPPQEVVPAPPCTDQPHNDFPGWEALCVLGPGCMDWVPLLQELIRRCMGDWKEYQRLSRRVGGGPGRVFAALGKEKLRQAKRLSAAEFLISGVRYWPEGEGFPPASSYLGTLRRRFMREQESMAACLAGADGCGDPSLSQLFLELAKEDWDFAGRIRGLLEQV